MDQELKQYLDANFVRIDERFTEVERRIVADLTEVEQRIVADLTEVEQRIVADVEKRIEKVETSLLGAFYGWARPMEIRVNGMTSTVMGFDERLALAEQRISELERRRAS